MRVQRADDAEFAVDRMRRRQQLAGRLAAQHVAPRRRLQQIGRVRLSALELLDRQRPGEARHMLRRDNRRAARHRVAARRRRPWCRKRPAGGRWAWTLSAMARRNLVPGFACLLAARVELVPIAPWQASSRGLDWAGRSDLPDHRFRGRRSYRRRFMPSMRAPDRSPGRSSEAMRDPSALVGGELHDGAAFRAGEVDAARMHRTRRSFAATAGGDALTPRSCARAHARAAQAANEGDLQACRRWRRPLSGDQQAVVADRAPSPRRRS